MKVEFGVIGSENISKQVSKFNVSKDKSKRTYNNIIFDSVLEMKFYRDWVLPKMESGDILTCDMQVKYELQEKFNYNGKSVLPVNYIADFVIKFKNNHVIIYDTKGKPDNVALLKRKLFWYKYPNKDYRWVTYSKCDGGWLLYEKVKQARKERKKLKNSKSKI